MKCVICKTGEVAQAPVQAEIKVGYDPLLVTVQAEACAECGEVYYGTQTLRYPLSGSRSSSHERDCSTFGGQSVPDFLGSQFPRTHPPSETLTTSVTKPRLSLRER